MMYMSMYGAVQAAATHRTLIGLCPSRCCVCVLCPGLCQRVAARLATKDELLRVHTPDHLHRLQLFCSGQVPPSAIPSDTYINQHTLQCAALAAGSAAEVAVRVFRGEAPCGAAIIRPPGHHAESNTGGCNHLVRVLVVMAQRRSCRTWSPLHPSMHACFPAVLAVGGFPPSVVRVLALCHMQC